MSMSTDSVFKNQKGQSLIEVIVALAVAVIVILALVRVTVTSIRNANFAKNRASATKYAQETIEKVRGYRDQADWSTFTSTFTDGCQSPPGLDPLPPQFNRTIECFGSDDMREVKVTVSWTDAQGDHSSELTTRLTNWK